MPSVVERCENRARTSDDASIDSGRKRLADSAVSRLYPVSHKPRLQRDHRHHHHHWNWHLFYYYEWRMWTTRTKTTMTTNQPESRSNASYWMVANAHFRYSNHSPAASSSAASVCKEQNQQHPCNQSLYLIFFRFFH